MAVNHPHFGTFCEICFDKLDVTNCATDIKGIKWDVHSGECAKQAGIKELSNETYKTVQDKS